LRNLFPLACKERVHLERRKLGTCWHSAEAVMRQDELEAQANRAGKLAFTSLRMEKR